MQDCPTLGISREGRILGKNTDAGEKEGGRKRGRTSRRIDCTKEAIGRNLQELSRAAQAVGVIQRRHEAEPAQGQVTLT